MNANVNIALVSKKAVTGLAVVLSTIAGICLALYPLRTPRPELLASLPFWFFDVFLVAGIVAAAGAAVALASLVFYVRWPAGTPLCRPARRTEIEMLHEFGEQYLGGTSSLNDAKRAYALNKDMFWGVWRERRRSFSFGYRTDLVGIFAVIPVNESARRLLAANAFEPHHVSSEYVATEGSHPAAVYIGGVAAQLGNKGLVLAHLVLAMLAFRREGTEQIFTRPISKRGLRLAAQYGFEPVATPGLNQIYQLQLDRLPSKFASEERPARIVQEHRERIRRRRRR